METMYAKTSEFQVPAALNQIKPTQDGLRLSMCSPFFPAILYIYIVVVSRQYGARTSILLARKVSHNYFVHLWCCCFDRVLTDFCDDLHILRLLAGWPVKEVWEVWEIHILILLSLFLQVLLFLTAGMRRHSASRVLRALL